MLALFQKVREMLPPYLELWSERASHEIYEDEAAEEQFNGRAIILRCDDAPSTIVLQISLLMGELVMVDGYLDCCDMEPDTSQIFAKIKDSVENFIKVLAQTGQFRRAF